MSFNIGENVGPYRILEQLGQGGMATVFKAYHASLDRYVALKVLHPAFNQDQSFISRFQREARVVAKLEHPNIVPIYDYSEHEARPYLVMKYIEGDTLKARLNKGPLTSTEIESVVNSIGYALAYAHRQGILHRDVKPSNVMIATDGMIYLADFGLARIAQAGESTMSSDSIMGTPQYISPEQAMGKKDLDSGTDIYSFGVMLYEMVVGQVPFSADTPFSIIHDHIYTPLPLPRKVNPSVPEPVQRVLLKALAKDRIDRYETAEELVQAFKDAWTEAGVPMQGTAIAIQSTNLRKQVEQTTSKPGMPTAVAERPSEKEPAKKKGFVWIWVGVGVVGFLCLIVAFLAIRNSNRATRLSNQANSEAPTLAAGLPAATQVAPPTLPAQNPGNGSPGNGLPPLNPQGTTPEITAAKDAVVKNPQDPNAHLQLAFAYWEAKQVRQSTDSMKEALTLAGPDNKEFLQQAAEGFKQREAWVASAAVYVRLCFSYGNQQVPFDVRAEMHQAVYKASDHKDMPLVLQFEQIETIDPLIAAVARSRYALYNGSLTDAKTYLSEAEKIDQNLPEITLLKAEIAMKDGNPTETKAILLSITTNPNMPEWIVFMANNYLLTMQ
jgi:serine/threonine protein kinase